MDGQNCDGKDVMKTVAAIACKNITSQSMQCNAGRCKPSLEVAAPSNKMSQVTLYKICKLFHQILCIRNVLNNKLLRSQYNKIVQQKFLSLFQLDLWEFGIKYNTFITVMQKCT